MKKSIFITLIIFLLSITFVSAISYTQTAADISPGVFADGEYYYPNTLYVGTDTDPGLSNPVALYIGDDAGGQHGLYYYGSSYYFPLSITSTSSSTSTNGVYSYVYEGNGIYGTTKSSSTSKAGVQGIATGGASGVYGYDSDGGGYGVRAYSSGKAFYTTGADYGLYVLDSDLYGVLAYSDSVGGKFLGDSYGVWGDGGYYGVYGSGDTTGVYGVSSSSTSKQCGVEGLDSASGKTGFLGCYNNGIYTPDDAKVDGELKVGSCTGCDIAEHFVGENLEAGDVVVLDSTVKSGVRKTTKPYDKLAAGIVSTDPTITMGLEEGIPIALSGVVPVKVIGVVHVGDLLTTSATAGYAMACTEYQKCAGAIIGKAMEDNAGDKAKITALVMLG